MTAILKVEPTIAACDLHPDFASTRSAEASGLPLIRVQHHVAHVAAVAAERRWEGPLIGVALDGHGYGADGGAWGGELIHLDGANWERIGSLEPLALPGGDRAARDPWRMGVAMLERLGRLAEAGRLMPGAPGAQASPRLLAGGARVGRRRASGACSTPPRRFPACASCSITRDRRRWNLRRWSRPRASSRAASQSSKGG